MTGLLLDGDSARSTWKYLARKYVHQLLLIEEFEKGGCQVEFVDRPMSQDPHDQLLLQIRGVVAEYERNLITERMRRGRLQKYRAGTLLPWSSPPYGYGVDPAHPRDPTGVRLAEGEAAMVAEMFSYYQQEGHTLRGLARHLTDLGVRGPRGGTHWSDSTIRGILTNPVYTGIVYAGRNHYRPATRRISPLKPVGGGNGSLDRLPPEEWIVVAQIPPIVSQEQFDMIQAKLKQNQSYASRNNKAHQYLLRALVSCGLCQLACLGRCTDTGHQYYACKGKLSLLQSARTEKCPSRFVPVEQLDELVWADICTVLQHPEILRHALEQAQAGQWLPQELQARRENVRKASVSLVHQVERLTEAYLAGILPLEEYKRRRHELEQKQAALASQVRQIDASVNKQVELAGVAKSMEEFCQRVSDGLEQASFEQKRQLVKLLVDRVIVTGEEVEIRYVIPTSSSSEHTRFCQLRADYFQPQRQKIIADHVLLKRPTSNVGLGEFHGINVRCCRHNGNQFGRGWLGFCWHRLPVLPPPGGQARIFSGVFFWWCAGNLTTKVTDEGDLQRENLIFLIG
jgi:site-specific DNA recombinase